MLIPRWCFVNFVVRCDLVLHDRRGRRFASVHEFKPTGNTNALLAEVTENSQFWSSVETRFMLAKLGVSKNCSVTCGYTCPVRRQLTLFCLKDSFEFSSLLNSVPVGSDKMSSFDINFPFTKVPRRETFDFLRFYFPTQLSFTRSC